MVDTGITMQVRRFDAEAGSAAYVTARSAAR
jgi:hypothetical protein